MQETCATELRRVARLRIGDRVTFLGRVCIVAGVSPMSVPARRVFLLDAKTGERLEASMNRLDHP